ncbi:MAG: glycosyltransferase, partial [FCB group bacterium]
QSNLGSQKYDQVWFEATHSQFDDDCLNWINNIAPVRFAFVSESNEFHPQEYKINPAGVEARRKNISRNLSIATNLICVDEKDVEYYNNEKKIPALWYGGGSVPLSFFPDDVAPSNDNPAYFFGTPYGERKEWMDYPSFKGLLEVGVSAEDSTGFPNQFNELNKRITQMLSKLGSINTDLMFSFIDQIRTIRKSTFPIFLDSLISGMAVVNLPQSARAYASRVKQGLAMGRVVVSFRIEDRPLTNMLFEDGKEILLYNRENKEELVELLRKIKLEPKFAENIARNALKKMLNYHSTELFVQGILNWFESGEELDFGLGKGINKTNTQNDLFSNNLNAIQTQLKNPKNEKDDSLAALIKERLKATPNTHIRLHLGCGEQYLDGYINIDYPQEHHNVMKINPDFFCDITKIELPDNSVDEIRLHHVFEHFNRVQALGLLIKWHKFLKAGGKLHIETPDLAGCAEVFLSSSSYHVKSSIARHLAGDQSASWAYHLDHWFPERYQKTFTELGFKNIEIKSVKWDHEPYLANVHAIGYKANELSMDDLISRAEKLLEDSTVSPSEADTLKVWKEQLRLYFKTETPPEIPINIENIYNVFEQNKAQTQSKELNLTQIHDFNQQTRDEWVKQKAASIKPGSIVIDVGAGTCPYKPLFAHCKYISHDFKKYEGIKLGNTTDYGKIDIESDIDNIPLPDNYADVILCTEVLEHVPHPIKAVAEMARILKPGGLMLITAPLGSGLHQLPYHYYGGYTPSWYRYTAELSNLDVIEITPNGGFFKHLSQEIARLSWIFDKHAHLHIQKQEIYKLFNEILPRYVYNLDDKCFIEDFTVGYFVEFKKKAFQDGQIKKEEKSENMICHSERSEESNKEKNTGFFTPLRSVQNDDNKESEIINAVVFSKDRSMQLDATLSSFMRHCKDYEQVNLTVLYKASNEQHKKQYEQLKSMYSSFQFIEETNFKKQTLQLLEDCEYILFLVDDNIFTRDFYIQDTIKSMVENSLSIGFSLRLGENTKYCYPLNKNQKPPQYQKLEKGILLYNWNGADFDFGYPLELSSSLYRKQDIIGLIMSLDFKNPNTLESEMAKNAVLFASKLPKLLCYKTSITFCNPLNKVQDFNDNRDGGNAKHSPESLAEQFDNGFRFDVTKYDDFTSNACHQEVDLYFEKEPKVSIIIPCFNQGEFLSEAVQSVVQQSYQDLELLIVNDGSPDNTSEVAKALTEKYPGKRIRLIEKKNGGLSDARNAGISAAKGKYILPLDADDKLHHDYLLETIPILDSHKDISIVYVDEQNFGLKSNTHVKGVASVSELKKYNVHDYCTIYRKEVWEKNGGYSPAMFLGGEDWNFWLGAAKNGFKSYHHSKPLFFYRNRENTMVAETLSLIEHVKSHIVFHHPELFTPEEKIQAENIIKSMPDSIKAKFNKIYEKFPENKVLNDIKSFIVAKPLVSVIIPTYNRPELLKNAINSVLSQTFQDFEIIVINDCGTDISNVIQSFNTYKIKYVRHETNKGLAAARNTGIANSTGKYISYLDDDDLYYPEHLQTLVEFLENNDFQVAYTDSYNAKQIIKVGVLQTISRELVYSRDFNLAQLMVNNYIPVLCIMHEKKCLEKCGLFDEQLSSHEDWDLWIRMGLHFPFSHIKKVTCEFSSRDDGSTMSSGKRKDMYRTNLIVYKKSEEFVKQYPHIVQARENHLQLFRREFGGITEQEIISQSLVEGISKSVSIRNLIITLDKVKNALINNEFYPAYQLALQSTRDYPDNPYSWLALAITLRFNIKPREAIGAITKSLTLKGTPEGLFESALITITSGNPEKGKQILDSIPGKYPDFKFAYSSENYISDMFDILLKKGVNN